jgi:hypothetical protein
LIFRRTAGKGYPAQEKRPDEPQLLPDVLTLTPLLLVPCEAKVEICLWVSVLWQLGHTGLRLASDQRIIFSNTSPQALQRYSYNGIFITSGLYILYPSIVYKQIAVKRAEAFGKSWQAFT